MEFVDLKVLRSWLILFVFLCFYSDSAFGLELKEQVEKELGVSIKLDTAYDDTWEAVTYERLDDDENLQDFLALLSVEFGKYPKGYFKKIELDTIIICKKLLFESRDRAAIPDPYMNTLLIDANYKKYKRNELIHNMHHELHHCTEFAIWGETYYNWPEWVELNIEGFLYGSRSVTNYMVDHTGLDFYSLSHPKKGFSTPYQMKAEEEDRCEIMALIFCDHERDKFKEFCLSDEIIMTKMRMIVSLMDDYWGTTDCYWHRQMSALLN